MQDEFVKIKKYNIDITVQGYAERGIPGRDAYEIAVEQGFVGDRDAWLASLVGPQGPEGVQGPQGVQGIQGPKGDAGPKGDIGPIGNTPDIMIGTVTTLETGENACGGEGHDHHHCHGHHGEGHHCHG